MEEMTNQSAATMPQAQDDFLADTEQSASPEGQAEASPRAGGNQTAEAAGRPEPAKETPLVVKFNKQYRTLSPDEARTFAQKGMKYDRVAPLFERISYLASRQGKTAAGLIDSLWQADEAALREELTASGVDADSLEARLASEREKHGFGAPDRKGSAADDTAEDAAGEAKQQAVWERLAGEFLELKEACPEIGAVSDLPDAVLADAAETGRNLLDSLLRYRLAQQKKAEAAEISRRAAADRSTGSMASSADAPILAANEAMIRGVWG